MRLNEKLNNTLYTLIGYINETGHARAVVAAMVLLSVVTELQQNKLRF